MSIASKQPGKLRILLACASPMADKFLKLNIEFNTGENAYSVELETLLQELGLTSIRHEYSGHNAGLYLSYPFPEKSFLDAKINNLNGYVKHSYESGSSPIDVHQLEDELASVKKGLDGLTKSVELVILTHATVDELCDQLESSPGFDILHIISHGTSEGTILLEDDEKPGWARHVGSIELADIVADNVTIFINSACFGENSINNLKLPENGQRPSVIIHSRGEYVIPSRALYRFSEKFYQELTKGGSAEDAFKKGVNHVRRDVEIGDRRHPDGAYDDNGPSPYKRLVIDQDGSVSFSEIEAGEVKIKEIKPPEIPHRKIRRDSDLMIGRQVETALVIEQLTPPLSGFKSEQKRLANLHGEGGIGKTRIALKACDRIVEYGLFPGGIYEIDCQEAPDTTRLAHVILQGIGYPDLERTADPIKALPMVLKAMTDQTGEILLMLDNLDDLFSPKNKELDPHPATLLTNILTECLKVKILSTCRTELSVGAYEADFRIDPLNYEYSRMLFLAFIPDQELKVKFYNLPDEEKVLLRKLLVSLAGHPLSIFLAAHRISRGKDQLTKRLETARKQFMEQMEAPELAGFPERQKSLRASLDLSYNLLSEEAKQTFRRSSFFPGGLVRYVPTLDELLGENWRDEIDEAEKIGLYRFNEEARGYYMLNPVREYAESKLKDKEKQDFYSETAKKWATFVILRDYELNPSRNPEVLKKLQLPEDTDERIKKLTELRDSAFSALRAEETNILNAFRWAVENDFESANNIASDLIGYLELAGKRQTLVWISSLMYEQSVELEDKARWTTVLGVNYSRIGDFKNAIEKAEEAVKIYRRLATEDEETYLPSVATSLSNLGNILGEMARFVEAREIMEEALEIRRKLITRNPDLYKDALAEILTNLGVILNELNESEAAKEHQEEALGIVKHLAMENPEVFKLLFASVLNNLGSTLRSLKEFEAAQERYEEALGLIRELRDKHPEAYKQDFAGVTHNLGLILFELEDFKAAKERAEETLALYLELSDQYPFVLLPKVLKTLSLLKETHYKLNDIENVHKYCDIIIKISDELARLNQEPQLFVFELTIQAVYLSGIGEKHKALEYLNMAKEFLEPYAVENEGAKKDLSFVDKKIAVITRELGDSEPVAQASP